MKDSHVSFAPEIDLRNLIEAEFKRRKIKNPRYSLRRFAQFLGLSHSAISEIFSGKRRVSKKTLGKICSRLQWDPNVSNLAFSSLAKDPSTYTQVESQMVEKTAEWYFNVILELFLLSTFKCDVDWIANQTNLDVDTVKLALKTLESIGMIKKTRSGSYKVAKYKTTTVGNLSSLHANRKLQTQLLQKQIQALQDLPPEVQSSLGLTIAIDPKDLPEARKIIYKCLKDLDRCFNRKGVKPSAVYRISLGVFPVTKIL